MAHNNQTALPAIEQTLLINAPIQKVWDFVSTSEGIESWFMPNDFEPKPGHLFHLQTPYGSSPCKVIEFAPPHRLSFTWDEDGWIVSFVLKSEGDKTAFTLIHDGWKNPEDIVPKAGRRNDEVRKTMAGGWNGICKQLRKIMET
ncbi:SRPBCC family protein [Sporolactobacillus putidus]|uniref:Activator of Hsp90 ATPase homologue 1/2-like C-terminal domain-containing protein n=1 Tax=Sporolactobacillus putidus TaxID=492735 RepID=A0A917W441_9BACL|nr:SRPBCC domain-containing protein [Sporolactobacillus putidus]GGL65758.1 hypothetical protein GCM10007968_32230 [Sporolactobacillus putidus]